MPLPACWHVFVSLLLSSRTCSFSCCSTHEGGFWVLFYCCRSVMERGIADLSIEDGEEEAFPVPDGVEPQNSVYNLCLVGRFLTSSVVHFPAMRNMMANLWHPLEGVQVSNLGEKLGSARAVRRLQHMLKFYNLQFVFFMEKIRRCCGFFNGVDVPAGATCGGLSLGWNRR
ncbi:hypothetical protein Golob_024651 [Gossypium lobatum]|uniref:Secreted protein n=1 Tax=Gossypium lobatum TaxID=34289 RepID=A0A7J8NLM8_9ROSI|nr:hypothetical protein [Gossypium lobatum]